MLKHIEWNYIRAYSIDHIVQNKKLKWAELNVEYKLMKHHFKKSPTTLSYKVSMHSTKKNLSSSTNDPNQGKGDPKSPAQKKSDLTIQHQRKCQALVQGPSRGLTPPPGTSSLPVSFLPDIPLSGTPLVRCPISHLLAMPSQGKQDHSPSGSH